MDSSSYMRAAVSAAVFVAVAGVMSGGRANISDYAIEAGYQAGAALGSDLLHTATAMTPSWISSGVVTGALFSAAKYAIRKDKDVVTNFAASAITDVGTDYVVGMVHARTVAPDGASDALQ